MGWISERIPFWSDPVLSKIAIIVVNLWVGIPYTMLIMTGLLMNIPEDLYESARIDGANGLQMFKSITLPYMFFVTGPFLLTQFTGNINNFNIIYLLNQGGPTSLALTNKAGYTDLLVLAVQDDGKRYELPNGGCPWYRGIRCGCRNFTGSIQYAAIRKR